MTSSRSYTGYSFGPLVNNVHGRRQEGYELDIPRQDPESKQSRHRRARNLLRFFIQGTPVERGQAYQEGLALVEKALVDKEDPETLNALRDELRLVLKNAFHNLSQADREDPNYENNEKLFNILVSNLISLYPFCDPVVNEKGKTVELGLIQIPQKIDGIWQLIDYMPQRLDISPKKGLLSFHQKQDKIFAYGFKPAHAEANSLLAFRGTPPPTLPGYKFANLFNFQPMSSLGEGHAMNAVDAFIREDFNGQTIDLFGHSQGGTMAMVTALRHPEAIGTVHALNPAPLSFMTLNRYGASWKAHQDNRARINVYAQKGDPVPYLDDGFPEGTHYYQLEPKTSHCSDYKALVPKFIQRRIEAHIRFFAGLDEVQVTELNLKEVNSSLWRDFFGDLKSVFNAVIYPIDKLALILGNLAARITNFCKNHQSSLQGLFGLSMAGLLGAVYFGFLVFPFTMPISLSIGLAIATTLLLPELVALISKPIKLAISLSQPLLQWTLLLGLLPTMAFASGIKIAIKSLCRACQSDDAEVEPEFNPIFAPDSSPKPGPRAQPLGPRNFPSPLASPNSRTNLESKKTFLQEVMEMEDDDSDCFDLDLP